MRLPVPRDIDAPRVLEARYAIDFEGASRALVHALKFQGRTSLARDLALLAAPLAESMAGSMAESMGGGGGGGFAVTHVPLAPVRRRERGFDQCELIALQLASILGVPHVRLLVRPRPAPPQASLDRRKRLNMMAESFAVRSKDRATSHRRLLLVDDVLTTGATMAAAACSLLEAGVGNTECLAIAGTPRETPGERGTR